MTTRREYAISLGLAQPGRGRMSREANAAIAKAESEGMTFDQPGADTPKRPNKYAVTDWKKPEPKPVVQKKVQESAEVDSKPFTGKFEAVMPDGRRKALSGRTACQCGASLVYCHCKTPTVGLLIVDPLANDTEAVVKIARA